jgi:2-oxoisovalerate dehydrogenase E1 component beta subunit
MTVLQAVNDALHHAMETDPDVVVLGEDIAELGGVFRATDGLLDKHGDQRVMNTPLAESGIIGAAIGMALYGLKAVPEIQFLDFIYPGYDQIVSEAAKFRYRSGGQYTVPMVIRSPYGGGIRGGHYHSQSSESYFIHTPGLKVVVPSDAADTKGLLLSAINDPDPVLFLEPKAIYRSVKGEVPEGDHRVPLGVARTVREGDDAVIICWGAMVQVAKKAAKMAEDKGWNCQILDLRTLSPLDEDAVLEAAKVSGRVVILHEAPRTNGFGGELSALIAERAIEYLRAPIVRVTGFDTPFPYTLEHIYMPDAKRTFAAIEKVMTF